MDGNYNSLVENVKELQKELRGCSESIIQLKTIIEQHTKKSFEDSEKLRTIEQKINKFEGAISVTNRIVTALGGSMVAFCVWIVTSNYGAQQRISDTNGRISVLESRLSRNEVDVKAISNDIKGYYDAGKN